MTGPYRAENWVLIAPDITGDNNKPAGVVHFDEDGYLTLVQCERISWGLKINDILALINAKDSLYDDAPDVSSNFFAQTNNLVQRTQALYPQLIKKTIQKNHNIRILKYQHTQEHSAARALLDEFDDSAGY